MNTPSTALKRLGIAAVVAATIGAGVPALVGGAAQAAGGPANQLNITPTTQTGAVGSCLAYDVTATDSGTKPSDTPTVTVSLTKNPSYAGTIAFCNPSSSAAPGTAGNPLQASTTTGTTSKNYSTTRAANGTVSVTVGVYSSTAGTVDVRAALTSNAAIQSNTAKATFSAASPSPSPTRSTSPPSGRPALTLRTTTPDIQPGQPGILIAKGAANAAIELRCYSRPSITYFTARTATINSAGDAVTFRILPGTNTRCFVQYQVNSNSGASLSVVVNVHTTLSLSAIRNAVRNYTFQGRNLPRRSGQLITLYRLSGGVEIRTAVTYTDTTGTWHMNRKFTGTGTFGFRVRTSQNLTNAAGVSYVYTVAVH